MEKNGFLEAIGFKYIINHNRRTKRVHCVKHLTNKCNVWDSNYTGYGTFLYAWFLKKYKGYRMCKHCKR